MRFALPFLLFIVGCGMPDSSAPAPDKKPIAAATLEAVTTQAAKAYLNAMADLCDRTAADIDAGKFKAQSQVVDQFKAESIVLREKFFGTIGSRFDKDVPPGVALDAAKTSAEYRKLANGFRGATK